MYTLKHINNEAASPPVTSSNADLDAVFRLSDGMFEVSQVKRLTGAAGVQQTTLQLMQVILHLHNRITTIIIIIVILINISKYSSTCIK